MLSEALSDSRNDVAVTAARALARLGDAGAAILKQAIEAGGGCAEVALEALEFSNSRESPVRS